MTESQAIDSSNLLRLLGEWAIALERMEQDSRISELASSAASAYEEMADSLAMLKAA